MDGNFKIQTFISLLAKRLRMFFKFEILKSGNAANFKNLNVVFV